MTSNSDITAFLTGLEKDVDKARSENDLLEICNKVRQFLSKGGTLAYNFTAHYLVLVITLLVGAGIWYDFLSRPIDVLDFNWWEYVLMALPVLLIIGIIAYISSMSGTVENLSERMFFKDILFDNSMSEIPISENEYDKLKERFGDFDRGDEDQEIEELLQVPIIIGNEVVNFQYYKFSYVVVTYVTTVVSNGKGGTTTVTRRVETTYYRYGLIGEFQWVKGIVVKSCSGGSYDYPATHKTGSSAFNKTYDVAAQSAHDAAKFLKPSVIIALEDIAQHTEGMAVEVNREGKMCISFADSDIIAVERKHSLESVDEFVIELSAKNCPPKLQRIVKMINVLVTHNDKNFS